MIGVKICVKEREGLYRDGAFPVRSGFGMTYLVAQILKSVQDFGVNRAMRQILIDELSKEERANIDSYLKRTVQAGAIDGMYWLKVPDDLYGPYQLGHDECGPFYFGIELEDEKVVFELLVRSQTNLHCSCICYATAAQRDFLLRFVDQLLESEKIRA